MCFFLQFSHQIIQTNGVSWIMALRRAIMAPSDGDYHDKTPFLNYNSHRKYFAKKQKCGSCV